MYIKINLNYNQMIFKYLACIFIIVMVSYQVDIYETEARDKCEDLNHNDRKKEILNGWVRNKTIFSTKKTQIYGIIDQSSKKPLALKVKKITKRSQIKPFLNEVYFLKKFYGTPERHTLIPDFGCAFMGDKLYYLAPRRKGSIKQLLISPKTETEAYFSSNVVWRLFTIYSLTCIMSDLSSEDGVIHGDLKPNHFLYDTPFDFYLNGFDYSYELDPDFKTNTIHKSMKISPDIGTSGYKPPEYEKGDMNPSSDIYSFSVLILQVLFAKDDNDFKTMTDSYWLKTINKICDSKSRYRRELLTNIMCENFIDLIKFNLTPIVSHRLNFKSLSGALKVAIANSLKLLDKFKEEYKVKAQNVTSLKKAGIWLQKSKDVNVKDFVAMFSQVMKGKIGKKNIMYTEKILERMGPFFLHLKDKGKSILGEPYNKVFKIYHSAANHIRNTREMEKYDAIEGRGIRKII